MKDILAGTMRCFQKFCKPGKEPNSSVVSFRSIATTWKVENKHLQNIAPRQGETRETQTSPLQERQNTERPTSTQETQHQKTSKWRKNTPTHNILTKAYFPIMAGTRDTGFRKTRCQRMSDTHQRRRRGRRITTNVVKSSIRFKHFESPSPNWGPPHETMHPTNDTRKTINRGG